VHDFPRLAPDIAGLPDYIKHPLPEARAWSVSSDIRLFAHGRVSEATPERRGRIGKSGPGFRGQGPSSLAWGVKPILRHSAFYAREAAVTSWNKSKHLRLVQFEWENESRLRDVRLASKFPQVGDPVRVTVDGAEIEARIEAIESSLMRVRVGRRLF
jgi:hypothetical protein